MIRKFWKVGLRDNIELRLYSLNIITNIIIAINKELEYK